MYNAPHPVKGNHSLKVYLTLKTWAETERVINSSFTSYSMQSNFNANSCASSFFNYILKPEVTRIY